MIHVQISCILYLVCKAPKSSRSGFNLMLLKGIHPHGDTMQAFVASVKISKHNSESKNESMSFDR